jgi:hypothetical protein
MTGAGCCAGTGSTAGTSAVGAAKHALQQAVNAVKQPLQSLITAATPKSPQVRFCRRGSALVGRCCHQVAGPVVCSQQRTSLHASQESERAGEDQQQQQWQHTASAAEEQPPQRPSQPRAATASSQAPGLHAELEQVGDPATWHHLAGCS